MTEQERNDIENAISAIKRQISLDEYIISIGMACQLPISAYQLAIRALQRWLDEDREDREHDESQAGRADDDGIGGG